MSDKEDNADHSTASRSRSLSPGEARSPERKGSPTGSLKEDRDRSRSRSRSKKSAGGSRHSGPRSVSRSRSRSRGRDRWRYSRSRSRSRSPYRRRRSRHSRSRSRSRSGGYEKRRSYYRSHSRSPMSSRRRHTGDRRHKKTTEKHQENPKTGKCLGVFGLSLYTQERDLRETFSKFGPIDEVQIVYDHQTGRSRGFGFIYMRNTEDACEAREKAPGTEIDGRKIRVDFSITKRAHTPTPGIYLGKPTSRGYGGYSRRSPSPYYRRGRYSRSRSRSYTPRRY